MLDHPWTLIHNDSDQGHNAVQENNDVDDDFDKDDNVLQKSSMQVAAQGVEDDTELIENAYANNKYVEPKDSHPYEFHDDGLINSRGEYNSTGLQHLRLPRIWKWGYVWIKN